MRIIGSERMLDIKNLETADNKLYSEFKSREADIFSSGRSAIFSLFSRLKQEEILFPDFYCREMIEPVLKTGTEIAFYTIKDDLVADTDSIIAPKRIKYIYINDYCGIRDYKLQEFAEKKRLIPIIDRTHSLFSNYPFDSGIQLGSLRKILPVPDGGFLINFKEKAIMGERDSSFYLLKLDAKILRELFERGSKDEGFEKEYVMLSEAGEKKIKINSKKISLYSEKVFSSYNIDSVAKKRKKNYRVLISHKEIKRICPIKSADSNVVFQSLPLLVDGRDAVKRRLADKSIFAPVLWRGDSSLSKRIINIPLDEEYSEEDMNRTAEAIINALNGE
ncbi:MAG: hypothetical protein AB7T10_07220 [bacterium]